jgi:hypothetical protein
VHEITKDMEVLQQAIVRYSVERMRMDPPEIDAPMTPEQLTAMVGQTITDKGLGGLEALRLFTDVLAPACISTDHPKFLGLRPCSPNGGIDALRPHCRCLQYLRQFLARECRRYVRRKSGTALDRRSGWLRP